MEDLRSTHTAVPVHNFVAYHHRKSDEASTPSDTSSVDVPKYVAALMAVILLLSDYILGDHAPDGAYVLAPVLQYHYLLQPLFCL